MNPRRPWRRKPWHRQAPRRKRSSRHCRGYRFTDDGVLHEIADTETAALRARLRATVENASEWQPLITWWLTAPQDRPLFPGDKLTPRERADQELAKGTWQGISNAYVIDPTHPLVHIAMAKDAHKKRDAFLRAYGCTSARRSRHPHSRLGNAQGTIAAGTRAEGHGYQACKMKCPHNSKVARSRR